MSEQPPSVSTNGLTSWENAVRRAEQGETLPVTAHSEQIADRLADCDTLTAALRAISAARRADRKAAEILGSRMPKRTSKECGDRQALLDYLARIQGQRAEIPVADGP